MDALARIWIILILTAKLLVQVCQHSPDELHNGNNEGTESQGSSVVAEHRAHPYTHTNKLLITQQTIS